MKDVLQLMNVIWQVGKLVFEIITFPFKIAFEFCDIIASIKK